MAPTAKEKADLNFKKLSKERLTDNFSATPVEIDTELQAVVTVIAATETIIATLAAGDSKEDAVKKKVTLEYKKFLLENRKESYGKVALLEKELDWSKLTTVLTEIDFFTLRLTPEKRDCSFLVYKLAKRLSLMGNLFFNQCNLFIKKYF